MAVTMANEGKEALLGRLNPNGTVELYKNDYTPVAGSQISDFTQANYSGYDDEGTSYGNSGIQSDQAVRISTTLNFAHNGGATSNEIYGYFVTYGSTLVYAERFSDAPRTMAAEGDRITFNLKFTLDQE